MKIWRNAALFALLIGGGYTVGSILQSKAEEAETTSEEPGSVEDPIVTKSYVDEQIEAIVKKELGESGTGAAAPSGSSGSGDNGGNAGAGSGAAASSAQAIVNVEAGQTLWAGAGTELIIRVGKAEAVSTISEGIADLTEGTSVLAGENLDTNHLLSFPRAYDRGLKHREGETGKMVIVVTGAYKILDEDGKTVSSAP